jgi:hypothetical protein
MGLHNVSELRPPMGLLLISQVIWVWRPTVEWYWQGENNLRKTAPVSLGDDFDKGEDDDDDDDDDRFLYSMCSLGSQKRCLTRIASDECIWIKHSLYNILSRSEVASVV